jgi:hypothetical protein
VAPPLITLSDLQDCIDAAESFNKERLDTLLLALPQNVQDAVFETMWILSGCPSPTSEPDSLRTIAHQDFGRLAFFDEIEDGVDRSTPMAIKHTALILAFQNDFY